MREASLLKIFLKKINMMPSIQNTNKADLPESAPENGLSKTILIKDLPPKCFRNEGGKSINGTITYPPDQESKLNEIAILFHGGLDPSSLTGVEIVLKSVPRLFVDISHSNQKIAFGLNCTGTWIFHLWGECNALIGDHASSNGTDCYLTPGGQLTIGNDCMFANIFLHVGDSHAIFDMKTGALINFSERPTLTIEDHVWIASRATVLADSRLGAGSILGAGSVAKGEFPRCSLITGIPGRITRNEVSWTRSYNGTNADLVIDMINNLPAPQS
jgi:acetyltransferase-like isoleucine patch superfamily enzyme